MDIRQKIQERTEEELRELQEEGLSNDILVRNYHIRIEFVKLRHAGFLTESAFEILSEKYFLSPKQIQRIVYQK